MVKGILILFAVIIVATLAVFGAGRFYGGRVMPVLQFEGVADKDNYGLEIVKESDPHFLEMEERYIGSNDELLPLMRATSPFGFFVKNNSSKDIVGISLRWTFVGSDGNTRSATSGALNPGVLIGMKTADPWMVGKTSTINSGDHRFFTYFDFITRQIENANKSAKYHRFSVKPDADFVSRSLFTISSIKDGLGEVTNASVSIDGVVYSDGTFIGDNQSGLFDRVNGMIEARRDFLQSFGLNEIRRGNTKVVMNSLSQKLLEIKSGKIDGERSSFSKNTFIQGYKSGLALFQDEVNAKGESALSDPLLLNTLRKVD